MPTEKKIKEVEKLAEMLSRCTIAIATDYRGLSAAEMGLLRSKLKERGFDYRVVKNTLTRLASEKVEKSALTSLLQGPVAVAFGYAEVTDLAKILMEHIRSQRSILTVKGGVLGNRLMTAVEVTALSTMPSKEVLVGHALQKLMSPLYSLHWTLNAPVRSLLFVLNGRLQQLKSA
ncbi:MAG: 50S ribosomal protein L10 [Chloroflexi bacterium]|nr:50S ribosomal protein L10 [Chloroflexota bacterium]